MLSKYFGITLAALAVAAPARSAAPAMASKDKPVIGVVVPTLDAQFWNNYVDFMKKGAAALGVELVVLNADNKPDQMVKSLEDLVARPADGIIFTPYWATAARGLTLAKDANIPVILTDVYADFQPQSSRFPNYLAFVGPERRGRGQADGRGAVCSHEAGRQRQEGDRRSQRHRRHVGRDRPPQGARGRAEAAPGSHGGAEKSTATSSATRRRRCSNPSIRGIPTSKASGRPTAARRPGVMTALKNAGKPPGKDVLVVAMDLNQENVQAVKNGDLLFDIGGHWLQGGFAEVLLFDDLKGKPVPKDQDNVKLKLLPLTKDTRGAVRGGLPGRRASL